MLYIIHGNIADETILEGKDAVVLPTNPKMRYGMGVSGLLFRKAGIEELERYCEKTFDVGYLPKQKKNEMKPGEIRVTPGFGLKMDILFAQGPNDIYFALKQEDFLPLLKVTYENLLEAILNHGYRNVLLPSLGTGHYGISHLDASEVVVPLLLEFSKAHPHIDLTLCLYDVKTKDIYLAASQAL